MHCTQHDRRVILWSSLTLKKTGQQKALKLVRWFLLLFLIVWYSSSDSRICSAPAAVSLKVHYVVSTPCEKEKTSDGAWMLLSTTAWVSVLSIGDSTGTLQLRDESTWICNSSKCRRCCSYKSIDYLGLNINAKQTIIVYQLFMLSSMSVKVDFFVTVY